MNNIIIMGISSNDKGIGLQTAYLNGNKIVVNCSPVCIQDSFCLSANTLFKVVSKDGSEKYATIGTHGVSAKGVTLTAQTANPGNALTLWTDGTNLYFGATLIV